MQDGFILFQKRCQTRIDCATVFVHDKKVPADVFRPSVYPWPAVFSTAPVPHQFSNQTVITLMD